MPWVYLKTLSSARTHFGFVYIYLLNIQDYWWQVTKVITPLYSSIFNLKKSLRGSETHPQLLEHLNTSVQCVSPCGMIRGWEEGEKKRCWVALLLMQLFYPTLFPPSWSCFYGYMAKSVCLFIFVLIWNKVICKLRTMSFENNQSVFWVVFVYCLLFLIIQ